jgi:hypothetical protein
MNSSEYSFLSLSLILSVILFVVWLDGRRKKRARNLNTKGLCARCGQPLNGSVNQVPISGGGEGGVWRGKVCSQCAAYSTRQDRAMWLLLLLAFAATLGFMWWVRGA